MGELTYVPPIPSEENDVREISLRNPHPLSGTQTTFELPFQENLIHNFGIYYEIISPRVSDDWKRESSCFLTFMWIEWYKGGPIELSILLYFGKSNTISWYLFDRSDLSLMLRKLSNCFLNSGHQLYSHILKIFGSAALIMKEKCDSLLHLRFWLICVFRGENLVSTFAADSLQSMGCW